MSNTDGAESGGGDHPDKDARLTICRDCGFVEATVVDDFEATASTAEDPGFTHYRETDHNVGSFEPRNKLAEQWGLLFAGNDSDRIEPPEKLWELATGQEVAKP